MEVGKALRGQSENARAGDVGRWRGALKHNTLQTWTRRFCTVQGIELSHCGVLPSGDMSQGHR